jgi:tRNA(His) 5'-end guanylyltransferase
VGNDSLGDRIKKYEAACQYRYPPRQPLIIRVDGRAFHTFTRHCRKPFDPYLMASMKMAMSETAKEMMGFKLAYHQSDEVTFLLTDYDKLTTEGWFGYEVNKVISLAASTFTAHFNSLHNPSEGLHPGRPATFDARAFVVPAEDAANVFIWRQRDWERNSVSMLAQAHFSHKQLHGKKIRDMHDMLHEKGINWAECSPAEKNGTFLLRDGTVRQEKADWMLIESWIQAGFERE